MECPKCHIELKNNQTTCPNCGASINSLKQKSRTIVNKKAILIGLGTLIAVIIAINLGLKLNNPLSIGEAAKIAEGDRYRVYSDYDTLKELYNDLLDEFDEAFISLTNSKLSIKDATKESYTIDLKKDGKDQLDDILITFSNTFTQGTVQSRFAYNGYLSYEYLLELRYIMPGSDIDSDNDGLNFIFEILNFDKTQQQEFIDLYLQTLKLNKTNFEFENIRVVMGEMGEQYAIEITKYYEQ